MIKLNDTANPGPARFVVEPFFRVGSMSATWQVRDTQTNDVVGPYYNSAAAACKAAAGYEKEQRS